MTECNISDCYEIHHGKGLCRKHYQREFYKYTLKTKLTKQKYYEKNKESIATKRKKYTQTDNGKKVHRKADRKRYKSQLERIKARGSARYHLKKEVCEIDNCNIIGEKYHNDYSKPLDINH